MKKFYLLILSLSLGTLYAQNIQFSDPNYKNLLLYLDENGNGTDFGDINGNTINIDANNDGEISLTEASQIYSIELVMNIGEPYWNNPMFSNLIIDGMENFNNLAKFNFISADYIPQNIDINFSEFPSLKEFACYGVHFNNSNLDFTSCPLLEDIYIENVFNVGLFNVSNCINLNSLFLEIWSDINQPGYAGINELDLSQNINLNSLRLLLSSNSNLSNLDLSNNPLINILIIAPLLQTLNLKNNIPLVSTSWHNFSNLYDWARIITKQNTMNICVDDFNIEHVTDLEVRKYNPENANDTIVENLYVNDFCPSLSEISYSKILGNVKMDINDNGYDDSDVSVPFQNFNLNLDNNNYSIFTNQNGLYDLVINSNYSTISLTPILSTNLFSQSTPENYSHSLPLTEDVNQNFSFTPTADYHDVSIYGNTFSIIPGFNSNYYLTFKNNGNTVANGTIVWQFPSDYMSISGTSETPSNTTSNMYSWNFSNLQPFESRTITIEVDYNAPTHPNFPLNQDDELSFISTININNQDVNPEDNQFIHNVIVTNSYDPNDKTCLEGNKLPNDKIGEYIHYRIRFENLGTANAQTVTVVDSIDISKFNITTLKPIEGSHNFQTEIKNNVAKFTFSNINLPFDDANNDGFVLFKIKTLDSVQPESIVDNQADIYFDYNYPVITNNEETLFTDNLGVDDIEKTNTLLISPNPVQDELYIHTDKEISSIEIYDVNGRLIQVMTANENQQFNVSHLTKGIYYIKANGLFNYSAHIKMIKQ